MKHLTVYQPEVEKGELTAKLTFRALALPQLTTKYFTCPPTRLNSFFKNSPLFIHLATESNMLSFLWQVDDSTGSLGIWFGLQIPTDVW